MPDTISAAVNEELGYFYDSLHGRIALAELPQKFHPALKAAFSSKSLARLKRIGQLGHTSVSFFSATHTRFSHAIGTMLVMNKLFNHVCETGLDQAVFGEAKTYYPDAVAAFGDEKTMVHCHLLLAALYQDTGELPFQKVTGQYFSVAENLCNRLDEACPHARPRHWTVKTVFSVLCLLDDLKEGGFAGFDSAFLIYLVTGDGAPRGAVALSALLQMVDGVVDADRLDYVYRDAAVTIGSLSRPRTVLESIVGYIPGGVIVNDPRPVTDFLSTRMRLWTFVYNSPDVRFMHALLKTVLDGQCDRPQALEAFKKAKLEPELTQPKFMSLDDSSLMERVEKLDVEHLEQYRQEARKLIQTGTFDYECLVLKRQETGASEETTYNLPSELFFDLMFDERQHQLYRSQTVFVRQVLTSKIDERVPLEQSAGAFAPLFAEGNSAMLVRGGFFVFQPRKRSGLQWEPVRRAMESGSLFDRLEQEDAQRSLSCPSDTRKIPGFKGTPVSVSYCFKDWPIVVRIVRELHKRKRRYHIILRQSDGIGGTATGNSQQLVRGSKAILVVASAEYLRRAGNANTYIGMEVDEIFATGSDKPKAVLCADTREELDAIPEWNWGRLDTQWRGEAVVASSTNPLRDASTESISRDVAEALRQIDAWKGKR